VSHNVVEVLEARAVLGWAKGGAEAEALVGARNVTMGGGSATGAMDPSAVALAAALLYAGKWEVVGWEENELDLGNKMGTKNKKATGRAMSSPTVLSACQARNPSQKIAENDNRSKSHSKLG